MSDEIKEQQQPVAPPAAPPESPEILSLREQLANAQKLIGNHANEVAEARAKIQEYEDRAKQAPVEEEPDWAGQKASLIDAFDNQEEPMSQGQFLLEMDRINEAKSEWKLAHARQEIKQEVQLAERAREEGQNFLRENPDFITLQQNGALGAYMKKHPGIVDEIAAYGFYKADEARAELVKTKTELEAKSKLIADQSFKEGARAAADADAGSSRQDLLLGHEGAGDRPSEAKRFPGFDEAKAAAMKRLSGG